VQPFGNDFHEQQRRSGHGSRRSRFQQRRVPDQRHRLRIGFVQIPRLQMPRRASRVRHPRDARHFSRFIHMRIHRRDHHARSSASARGSVQQARVLLFTRHHRPGVREAILHRPDAQRQPWSILQPLLPTKLHHLGVTEQRAKEQKIRLPFGLPDRKRTFD